MSIDFGYYLNLPFKEKGRDPTTGVDCWGLLRVFYLKEFSLELPENMVDYAFDEQGRIVTAAAQSAVNSYFESEQCPFTAVEVPQFGDGILFRENGEISHIGVVINSEAMLNARRQVGVGLEKFRGPYWSKHLEGFYRHVNRTRC